jgi:hypothetical protein
MEPPGKPARFTQHSSCPLVRSETFQDLDEAPRILLAIAQQAAPELFPRLWPKPVPLAKQPDESQACRLTVGNRQTVIPKFGNKRGKHALQAEAAAEARMIDVVPHRG